MRLKGFGHLGGNTQLSKSPKDFCLGVMDEISGLRIFRWTAILKTDIPTVHPSDLLVYNILLLYRAIALSCEIR